MSDRREDWRHLPLKRLFSSVVGGAWGSDPTNDAELVAPCIRGTDFDFDRLRVNLDRAPDRGFTLSEFQRRAAVSGDMIIEKSGGGEKQPVGRVVLYEGSTPVMPTNFAARLRPAARVHPQFVTYLMAGLYGAGYTRATINQTTGIQNLDLQALLSTIVSVPPLSGQQAIADFLDSETARIDALIAKKREMIRLIGERRMAAMVAGVSGRFTSRVPRRESNLPWLDSIPAHWDEVGLTLVARLGSGHTPSRKRADWWVESDCTIPWITTGEVARLRSDRVEYIEETRERISPIGLDNSAAEVHAAGTVVLCRTASAGYSGIMRRDMATSQDFATWTCGPLLRPRFLLLCLRAMRADLLGRLAMGSTHQTIYMPDIQSLRIPLPPVDEQDQIVDSVWAQMDSRNRAQDLLARQTDLLVERRQALITAAVTGELAVAHDIAVEAP